MSSNGIKNWPGPDPGLYMFLVQDCIFGLSLGSMIALCHKCISGVVKSIYCQDCIYISFFLVSIFVLGSIFCLYQDCIFGLDWTVHLSGLYILSVLGLNIWSFSGLYIWSVFGL